MKTDKKAIFVYLSMEDSSYSLGKADYRMSRRPQLGFQYMVSVLEAAGIPADIWDQSITPFSHDELIQQLREAPALFVGFYSADAMRNKLVSCIATIKQAAPEIPVVVGGPAATLDPQPYLEAGTDIVAIGEGEVTVLEICEYLLGKQELATVNGVCHIQNGSMVQNPVQPMIPDLDTLPFPNRDKIHISNYLDHFVYNVRLPYTTMITSRGCPYRCTFCTSHEIWNKKVRTRSVGNVMEEIDILVNKYGVKYISFQDDVFGLSASWVRDFTDAMIEKNFDLNWMCILHPLSFRNKRGEMLDRLKKAGCDTISLGLQSADPTILKNIKRMPQEPEMCMELITAAKQRGMLTAIGFIFGSPGETGESLQCSIDFALKCQPHHAEFYTLDVLKGSQIDVMYGEESFTAMSSEQLNSDRVRASRTFYSHPAIIYQNIAYILRYRPSWILAGLKFLPFFLKSVGFSKR
jgi:anaerobic magnesium-protoporphyrin IX monomethyl ester cyclase